MNILMLKHSHRMCLGTIINSNSLLCNFRNNTRSLHFSYSSITTIVHSSQLLEKPNKSAIKIQSRGIRHKIGGSEGGEESASSSSKSSADDKIDEKKFAELFKSKFTEFLLIFREEAKNDRAKMKNFKNARDEFLNKFNKEHEKTDYKIERMEEKESQEQMIGFGMAATIALLVAAFWTFRPKAGVRPEHREIASQSPITFDEFVSDFLSAGEVQLIFQYPNQNMAIAILQPGAVIKGQQFASAGVHVALDESFRFNPTVQFVLRIREEERKLGISATHSVPIGIQQVPTLAILCYVLGFSGFIFFAAVQWLRVLASYRLRMFKVVPRHKGGSATTKQKIE